MVDDMYKVILVDDEEIIVTGLKKIIDWKKYDCEVVAVAHTAAEGSHAIWEHNPHILFTDIRMPDNDGLFMLAGLRSEFPNMQVTVLSGYNDFAYAQQAMCLGVSRYLLKPSKINEINEALGEMVKRLGEVTSVTEEEIVPKEKTTTTISDANSFIVRNAVDYIQANFQNKVTLAEVAEKVYVSQWHLSKLLNKHTDKKFYDILNEFRIQKAKELLEDPSLRISDISDMVGYVDSAHFSKVFKKEIGVSANTYRASVHNQK